MYFGHRNRLRIEYHPPIASTGGSGGRIRELSHGGRNPRHGGVVGRERRRVHVFRLVSPPTVQGCDEKAYP